jgi:Flp pilus assembly protein TadD
MNMNRTLIASAIGILSAYSALAWGAQPTTSPNSSADSAARASGREDWGNSSAVQDTLKLAQPDTQPGVTKAGTGKPHGPKSVGRRRARGVTNVSACADLPAKWSRAQVLAAAGKTPQAYALYLALLHACNDPGELTGTAWKAAQALPAAEVDRLIADPVFDKLALQKVRTDLRLQRMYAENHAGHYENALAYSRVLRADPSVELDAAALEVSGWLESRAHDDNAAELLFRAASKKAKDPSSAQFGLALALMQQQRIAEAEAEAQRLTTPEGKRLHAAIKLALVKDSHDAREVDAALEQVDGTGGATDPATRALAGWALLNSGRPARAEAIFGELHQEAGENEEYLQGLVYAAAANRDYETLRSLLKSHVSGVPPLARETLAERDERLGLYDHARALTGHPSEGQEPATQALFTIDRKSGTAGQDKLTIWTMPQLSITTLVSPSVSVRIDATAIRLDDGRQHAWGKQLGATARTELGQGVLFAGAALEAPGEAPLQVLGKIQYQQIAESEDEFVRVTLNRDSIYDSLRAFQGVPSGPGPALSSSLEVAARQAISRSGFYLGETLSGGTVTATGTAVNPFYAASLSLTRDFRARGWSWLNAGPDVRISSYRYDANRFDGPFAGYWSPKSNREAGLVFYAQSEERGRFLFKTGGRVGFATRELFTGRASGAFGENTTSFAGLVSRHLIVGAGIGYRASPGYHDMSLFAWLKVPLEPRGHLRAADLVTPRGF